MCISAAVLLMLTLVSAAPATDRRAQPWSAAEAAAIVGLRQPVLLLALDPAAARPGRLGKLDLSDWFIEDRMPVASWQQNSSEATAYVHVLVQASRAVPQELARAARRDLTRVHLFEESAKYRGEIVFVSGQLMRVRRFDAPALAQREGLQHLYEGWVFSERLYGARPYCIVFTSLPEGIPIGDSLRIPVEFAGYYFKRYRYEAASSAREAPLLIGRQPVVIKAKTLAEDEQDLGEGTMLVSLFLGLLGGTMILALGLAWWYHRGDRQIRARIAAARPESFVPPE